MYITENIDLRSLRILYIFVLRAEKPTIFDNGRLKFLVRLHGEYI